MSEELKREVERWVSRSAQQGSDIISLKLALERCREHISATPHGDNCHLTDEFPGNQCVCGKESILDFIDSHVQSTEKP